MGRYYSLLHFTDKKLRHRNIKELVQDYTASEGQNKKSKWIRLALVPIHVLNHSNVFLKLPKNYLKHLLKILFPVPFSGDSCLEGLSCNPEHYNFRILWDSYNEKHFISFCYLSLLKKSLQKHIRTLSDAAFLEGRVNLSKGTRRITSMRKKVIFFFLLPILLAQKTEIGV